MSSSSSLSLLMFDTYNLFLSLALSLSAGGTRALA